MLLLDRRPALFDVGDRSDVEEGLLGNVVEVAGTTAVDESGQVVGAADPATQTRYILQKIERALQKSDLGLNPMSDGKTVRIPIPQPTEERRKELVKKAHDIAEHARTQIRLARREANDKLKKLEKGHELGQDDERRALEEIQKLHDREIDEVAKVLEHKEKDKIGRASCRERV